MNKFVKIVKEQKDLEKERVFSSFGIFKKFFIKNFKRKIQEGDN